MVKYLTPTKPHLFCIFQCAVFLLLKNINYVFNWLFVRLFHISGVLFLFTMSDSPPLHPVVLGGLISDICCFCSFVFNGFKYVLTI